ncbi:MAG: tRNA (adenosine(37)-N6)-threonylcarbamoyltransferase complex ATPase subunit type 1 TsaE [Dehalococcoidia bacterium]|jgi:tRNA threonylcarbamoyladenosine biosynthesis protein TsaE|nr:tRNA (adenosine(37)-N6)-threonylcarbamoyltransferase complex ATPase subunit type 1 TsaE [Dehalococcoidia bacterium]
MVDSPDAAVSETLIITTRSEAETVDVGRAVGAVLEPRDVVLLSGELGAGKTRLVEGMTRGIEADAETRSPTFVLVNEYVGRLMLAHCDLYRLSGPEETGELGLDDYLARDAALAVEWPERARCEFPPEALEIQMGFGDEPDDRVLTATATGEAAIRLLKAMRDSVGIGQHAGGGR